MEEIVKENVLDAIHHILKNQRQYMDEEKMKKADELIVPYIEENFEYRVDEFKVKRFGPPVLSNDRRIFPILIRYYAIMQDNLSLLSKLEDENFSFIGNQHAIKLFTLDKQLSSKFKEIDYIHYLIKYGDSIEHFYNTLRGLNQREREKVLKEFAEIVKSDPTTLNVGKDEDKNNNFLTRRNIELFGKEFLLNLSDKQRNLINSFYFQVDEKNISKIKELVTKYPDFTLSIPLYSDVFKILTVDELGTMSEKDRVLYDLAAKANLLVRMKKILDMKPDFDCPKGFIKYEIFKVLSNEEILDLSYEVMEEIGNLKIVELNNAYVFPVKKINSIIYKDKFKKRKDEIIERIDVFHRK